ncbi:MAG: DNA sulfur modification protein DndB, partial [Nitrosotalea sp.]
MSKTLVDETETGSEVYGFDALRGAQAGHEFYVAMCPLKIISKLFIYNDEEIPPELRAQRTLRASRIPEIANYIINNPKDYAFSSLTASVDGKMKFSPSPSVGEKGKIGRLHISMDSRILINDGQHRMAAIKEALKHRPELGNESISVVFFPDFGLKRSQQMFSDLNKHAIKPTKSLGILYDHRDSFAKFIVNLANTAEIFRGRVELEKTSISNRSTKFFTLNGISEATHNLLKSKSRSKLISAEQQKFADEYWNEVAKNIPEWQLLVQKKVSAHELRKEFVHAHTNLVMALGVVGNVLYNHHPNDWKAKLKNLQKIDWSRSNPEWDGRIIQRGVMLKTRIGIELAANTILKACGVKLPPERIAYE